MPFIEATHDEEQAQRFRSAAVFLRRLRKCASKIKYDEVKRIRQLALDGNIDEAEDALVLAVTGEERVRPSPFPVKVGKVRKN